MARSKKPRSFGEPWHPRQSVRVGPRPDVEGLPEDAAQSILDAHERAIDNAPYIVWAELGDPHITTGWPDGQPEFANGERALFELRPLRGMKPGTPTHAEVAERIAECVNALAGVADPTKFIDDVRAVLLRYLSGDCVQDPREDTKLLGLAARCIPPEQQDKHHEAEEE